MHNNWEENKNIINDSQSSFFATFTLNIPL
jgi:hypothetical protein